MATEPADPLADQAGAQIRDVSNAMLVAVYLLEEMARTGDPDKELHRGIDEFLTMARELPKNIIAGVTFELCNRMVRAGLVKVEIEK